MECKEIDLEVEQLLTRLARRLSADDITRINDAYLLAREAHKEQRRKSGEPYIMHPVAVAKIVAEELRLGANPIIAAFLHDVVEDTPYTVEDIEQRSAVMWPSWSMWSPKRRKRTRQASRVRLTTISRCSTRFIMISVLC